jgi:hypothetical protein
MKRRALLLLPALGLALVPISSASPALAFHHVALPTECAASANASNNVTAKTAIAQHNPAQTLPLPPVGTPSRAVDAPAPEHCTNA